MRNLILILLLFATSIATAQSNQPFFAARAIMPDAPGDLGSDMYRVVLEISDQTGVYDGLDVRDDSTFFLITQPIAVGDDINLYPVLAIGPAYANIITVDVLDIDAAGPPNMGSQVLCEQSPDGLFAYVSGAGDPLNQAISDYNMKRVELELASRIDSLEEGLNVTFSGTGTNEDPLVINASGGGAGTDDQVAAEVPYDNSTSGLAATEVQTAIDLLENEIDAVSSGASDGVATAGALDVANQELDMTIASPGSNFSINLGPISTMSQFSAWDKNAADDFSGDFLDLNFVGTTGLADGVDNVNDADSDPANEIQDLTWSAGTGGNDQLTLSNGGGSVTITDDVDDADADPTNELQTISKTGSTVTLSDGGGSFTDAVDDADADPANEIQTISSDNSGDFISISLSGSNTTNFGVAVTGPLSGNGSVNNPLDVDLSGVSTTASNGLSIDGVSGDVELGGTLSGNTTILGGAYDFRILSADEIELDATTIRAEANNIYMGRSGTLDLHFPTTAYNDINAGTGLDIFVGDLYNVVVPNSQGGPNALGFASSSFTDRSTINSYVIIDTLGFIRPGFTNSGPGSELGMFAYNPGTNTLATWDGSQWSDIGGGGAGTDDQVAAEVPYDNSTSGLAATEVQTAIDLLENEIDAVSSGASDGVATAGALDVANQELDITVASPGSDFSINLGPISTMSQFAAWDKNAADDFSGAWGDISGIPADFSDGVDDRLTSGAVDLVNDQLVFSGFNTGFTVPLNTIDQLNIFDGWDKNAADDFDGAWSSLTGIPAGFADGVDNVGSGPTDEEVEDLVGPMFTTSTGHTRGFSFTYDDINSQIDVDHVGEHLQLLNFTPTYYTRVTDGIDFPFAVDLGSHLNGIDLMFEEVIPDAAFVSTTSTIDAGNESSHFQVVNMTGVSNKSLTFSNIPNGGAVILLFINADDTDTITWPSTVKWETGAGVDTDFLSTGRRMIQLIHDGTDYWVPGGY